MGKGWGDSIFGLVMNESPFFLCVLIDWKMPCRLILRSLSHFHSIVESRP